MDKVQEFVSRDVKLSNGPYWSQFKSSEWVLFSLEETAKVTSKYEALDKIIPYLIAYLKGKKGKMRTRLLKRLLRSMELNLSKFRGNTVKFIDDRNPRLVCGDLVFSILEDQAFVFQNRFPVFQVSMNFVNIFVYLLPKILRLC